MTKQTGYHRLIIRDKGVFNGKNFLISTDSLTWIPAYAIFITEKGQLYSSDEHENNYLLLQYLQSCYIQVIPNINSNVIQQKLKRKITKKESNESANVPPVIYIKTFDNEKLYIKVPSKNNFSNLLCSLIVWQNLKPKSLVKKWYCENKAQQPDFIHEVLVCRFKVYGPILNKGKNLNLTNGAKVPSYQKNIDYDFDPSSGPGSQIPEGWFYTMGVLKSNGILNFVTELDGTLIYSIDIKKIMSSEIREVHHSLFDNSNVLFIGQIKELRWNNQIKSVSTSVSDQHFDSFIVKDSKTISSYNRVLIEFPLHIDLEDWFVGLNYFSKREYIGSFNPKTALNKSTSTNDIIKRLEEFTLNDNVINTTIINSGPPQKIDSQQNLNSNSETSLPFSQQDSMIGDTTISTFSSHGKLNLTSLSDYDKEFFRISKKLAIDIIEAKFDHTPSVKAKIYAEVVMWGLPWSRTALVNYTANPFWKEEFATDLPISTQIIHILIKKCSFNENGYLEGDKVIGTVYLTPDVLTRHLNDSSTMLIDGVNGATMNVNGAKANDASNNDIVKLSIYDSSNVPIGKLLVNVNLKEYHILSPKSFKPIENMLHNAPMKDLITFCNQTVSTSDFENVSIIMLDIFQSLGIEDRWFKELMDAELINVDKVTRQNYVTNNRALPNLTNNSSSNNVFNTLFRGSSIFSKSLEKYNLRIGQEYLEKVFGNFFAIIDDEKKSCEVDPRYVRLQERAERKGQNLDGSDLEDGSDLDEDDYDSDEEAERDQKIKNMVDANFENLYNYAEMIWHKIYITSNDLPDQIKLQLKHFRNKVELACDPNDKITALNCLSAFIFLRFFCPAILNPKLFYLTKNHQTGRSQRTLTLIAKILLNLANRQEFSPHKEPHLVKMNKFLEKHKEEVLDYFDKITGRKNDFHEKILELSHEVKRFDLGLSGDSTSNELPTTPYLIDKYLRLTELIYLLDNKSSENNTDSDKFDEDEDDEQDDDYDEDDDEDDEDDDDKTENSVDIETKNTLKDVAFNVLDNKQNNRRAALTGIKESDIKIKKNVYQIGSLEFEKSEFLDLAGDNETESFLKSLVKSDENIFSFITSNITLKDLQKALKGLRKRVTELEAFLSNYEYPSNYQSDQMMWDSFTNEILRTAYIDLNRNCLVQIDNSIEYPNTFKRILDSGVSYLKLKFPDDNEMPSEVSQTSLSTNLEKPSKNPFKKWFKA